MEVTNFWMEGLQELKLVIATNCDTSTVPSPDVGTRVMPEGTDHTGQGLLGLQDKIMSTEPADTAQIPYQRWHIQLHSYQQLYAEEAMVYGQTKPLAP